MPKRKSIPRKKKTVKRRVGVKRKTGSSTTKTPKKKILKSGSNAAHHAVRVAPFSNATSQPKIPDGMFTSSLSRRLQAVTEIQNNSLIGTDLGQSTMYIVLSPTLGVPAMILNAAGGAASNLTWRPQFVGCFGQGVHFQNQFSGGQVKWPPHNSNQSSKNQQIANLSGFSQWRIVSQGLRLELTNTDQENDGWFEAFRFNPRNNDKDVMLTPLDDSGALSELGYAANPHALGPILKAYAGVEQPGYKTGLLRDIHKYEFMLHPQSTTHDPVEVEDRILYQEGTQDASNLTSLIDTNYSIQVTNSGDAVGNNVMKQGVDMNMDWMLIKLHCRNNDNVVTFGSKFILNVMQNIEFAVSASSDLASFQTVNKHDKKHADIADMLNNQPDAVMSRRK